MAKASDTPSDGTRIDTMLLTRTSPGDRELLDQIGRLATMVRGVRTKDAYRNFLFRYLPVEIQRLETDGGAL